MSAAARVLLRRLPRDCLVVLGFHRVGDDLPPWHVGTPPRRLEAVVSAFASAARPVTLAEVAEHGVHGRMLALTFDDGFDDGLEAAAPLLRALGLPAAFFLTVDGVDRGQPPWPDEAYARLLALPLDRLGRLARRLAPGRPAATRLEAAHAAVHGLKELAPGARARVLDALPDAALDPGRMLTWDGARSLAADGFEVGSHCLSHAPLTTVDDAQLADELLRSRRRIEDELGVPCDLVAYPDARVDARVATAAAAAGYRLGLAGGDAVHLPGGDHFAVRRLSGEDPRLWRVAARAVRPARRSLAFEAEAEGYASGRAEEYGFVTQARIVREALAPLRPARVLDAGCGAGALVPSLREVGVREVVGVDAAREMVEAARRLHPQERWLRGDVAGLPLAAASFDAVVSLGVLEYVADPAAALRELARVVVPGGPVVVSVPQRRSPNALALRAVELLGGRREGSRPLSPGDLRRAAAAASLEVGRMRATNFFVFPFTNLAPRASRRAAELLEPLGRLPFARRLGAQLVVELRRPQRRPLFWLVPAVPTATTFLERELSALRRRGVEVVPLAPTIDARAALAVVRRPLRALRLVVELQRLKARRDRELGRVGYLALALRGFALAERLRRRPGRLHAAFADGVGTVGYVATRLGGRPFSFTAHAPYSLWQRSALLARQAEAADVVIAASPTIADGLASLSPDARVRVVPVAAPAGSAPPRAVADPPYVLAVARLIPHKGFATAIEAFSVLAGRGRAVRLDVVGDGPERGALERRAAELGLAGTVRFLGALPNESVLGLLARSVAMVAPCEVQPDGDRDGLPASIVDAAWCATPVIATPVGAITDFVVDGETGLLVPERDPVALAGAVERLLDDPALGGRLGAAARALAVRDYDPDRVVDALLRAWGDVDADHAPSASSRASRNCSTAKS